MNALDISLEELIVLEIISNGRHLKSSGLSEYIYKGALLSLKKKKYITSNLRVSEDVSVLFSIKENNDYTYIINAIRSKLSLAEIEIKKEKKEFKSKLDTYIHEYGAQISDILNGDKDKKGLAFKWVQYKFNIKGGYKSIEWVKQFNKHIEKTHIQYVRHLIDKAIASEYQGYWFDNSLDGFNKFKPINENEIKESNFASTTDYFFELLKNGLPVKLRSNDDYPHYYAAKEKLKELQ